MIRLAGSQLRSWGDEHLVFLKQLGVEELVYNTPPLPGQTRWEFMDILQLRTRTENAGLKIAAIENVPRSFFEDAMIGGPKRDEQIENYQTTVRNVGKAGIPILGFAWNPSGVWRTSRTTRERGGALVTAFDYDLVKDAPLTFGREIGEAEMWGNYEYFLKAVVPVAEEVGVKLALHPSDPPVPVLGGVAQLMRSFENFKRAMEVYPSDALGLDFCQGCWSEMGTDLHEAIRHFASRGKILYVHFRNVVGAVPKFRESFVNTGDTDMFAALKTYKEAGFDGFIIDDHVPHLVDDTNWGHRSRAYAMGYIQALLDVLKQI